MGTSAKNKALASMSTYSRGTNRIDQKATIDQVAQQSADLSGTWEDAFGSFFDTNDAELKQWLLWRSLLIAIGVVLLVFLLLHFKAIKLPG